MPPLSKKRKACFASTAKACEARKARRVPDDDSDIELYFDSEEEGSELDGGPGGADVDEELVIEGDALACLMAIASSIDSDSLAEQPNFKYQRGVQQCRKKLYRTQKKQADLQHAAANTAKITEFFTQKATVNTDSGVLEIDVPEIDVPGIRNQLQ
ncbi:hypothetical protein L211DRAFT_849199 [Terfezia boudieri ATCC MYA-4762]|uniref:Uncharacterized protein n=1 Tax=Terfezia boudieri ATCC MYA-4762 TaxID=1051890 RepID=A0A3N4LMK9_9PEZI|nr:hypothetical protein L211DRAFT_849199 [Terfezia boudieri ATCC MYA-4762]